ncbi:hypothetical protein C8Q80DRAFT_1123779 [Daedaleopsis nitida]|nr:hypothetical protein C8Q80DRAFT_1123779 [Daedaleopsis nitida]
MYHIRDGLDHLRRGLRRLGDGETTDGVLVVTLEALSGAQKAADSIPVPGLDIIFELLHDILEKAQTSRANRKALRELREELSKLYTHLDNVKGSVDTRLQQYSLASLERKELTEGLPRAQPLMSRVELLQRQPQRRDLRKICNQADKLGHGSWFSRWFFSEADDKLLKEMKVRMSEACNRFQYVRSLEHATVFMSLTGTYRRKRAEQADARVLEQLSPGLDASFRAAINEMKSHYLKDTRKELFEDLHAWIDGRTDQLRNKRVVFLRGEAGIGKSTVATELCRRLQDTNVLGASFFFTRGAQKLDSTELFFPTIAVQLATLQPSLRPHIVAAARKYLQAGKVQRMQFAYEELLQKPLSTVSKNHPPFVIVVDALDECTQQAAKLVPEFLQYLLTCATSCSTSLRILILSRPEMHYVREVLDAPEFRNSVKTLVLSSPRYAASAHGDIRALIVKKLNDHEWSKKWSVGRPEVVKQLTDRSNGVFIYAETATNFLLNEPNNLDERLDLILSIETPIGFSNLDMLYLTVLETAFPKKDRYPPEEKRMRQVLGYIACLREQGGGFTPRTLEYLTGMSVEHSMSILNKLRSVVHFEFNNPDARFRVVHLTFREFLLSQSSPDPFHVTLTAVHGQLAVHCMTILLIYAKLPGWNPGPELQACQESSQRAPGKDRPFPFHVWYAVTHLEEHKRLAGTMPRESIVESFETMIRLKPLEHWMSRPIHGEAAQGSVTADVKRQHPL